MTKIRSISQQGFTLIELIVTMGIIAILMTVSVVNFRSGQQDDVLRFGAARLADAIRTAQSDAIGGRIPQGQRVPAPAYGIRLMTNLNPALTEATLFADNGTPNKMFDTGEETGTASIDPNKVRPTLIVQSIELTGSGPGTGSQSDLTITFDAPSAAITFNGSSTINEAVITVQHTGTLKTKKITVNRITGRIEAEY